MIKGIIIELIPDKIKNGDIIQISALKVRNNIIEERLDIRYLKSNLSYDIQNMISYDNDKHKYLNSSLEMLNELKKFTNDYPLYIMSDNYTKNYLKDFKTLAIEDILNEKYDINLIDNLKKKYNIQDTNYIVDILYEALILK